MKVTLTIEVPDDFKKGNCDTCPFTDIATRCWREHTDCPLEIQDIPEDIPMEYFENGGI